MHDRMDFVVEELHPSRSPIHGHILIRKSFVEVSGGLMRCIPRANGAIYIEGHAI